MDPCEILNVRFHLGGAFDYDGYFVQYVGGRIAMSHIERDKLSIPELKVHLADHCTITEEHNVDFHWLLPGEELNSGLKRLVDDKECLFMADCIAEGRVAEVFVEVFKLVGDEMQLWYSEQPASVVTHDDNVFEEDSDTRENGNNVAEEETDTEDEDYEIRDEDISDDDEEANLFRTKATNQRRNPTETALPAATSKVQVYEGDIDHDIADPLVIDSSDEASYDEQEDGEAVRRKSRFARFDGKAPIPKFEVSMTFRGREECKSALIKYGLVIRRHLIFIKDERDKIRAKCSWPNCPWMLFASTSSNSYWFQVKTLVDTHVCPQRKDNKLVTARRIADKYERIIKANPSWKLMNIKETIMIEMGAEVNISKVKRAKGMVMRRIFEACKGEYAKMFEYQVEIIRTNPGSTVACSLDSSFVGQHVFQRFYVCFDACKRGFLAGCRKMIGVDGCFFKGATNGELICALGRDANNQIYPVAWAVVEKETEDSWSWFLGLLQKDLHIPIGGQGWVIISDQQKGLLNAVQSLFPNIEHRMCTRHIYANWRKKFRDQAYQKPFWMCAKASSVPFFNFCKAKLAQLTPAGAKEMMNNNPKHWSRAWFNLGSFCDSVDNNMCESFNNWIIDVRAHPILSMFEGIRTKVFVRIQQNRGKSSNWPGRICPSILKKLNKYIDQAQICIAMWNGKDGFEVKERDNKYKVDLEAKTCSCRYWQLAGIPCAHAIAALFVTSKKPEDYIADCYSIEAYNNTYDHCLLPMEGMDQWPPTDHPKPAPPGYVKMPGRPRKERRREEGEVRKGTKMTRTGLPSECSRCHKTGQNTRTCSAAPRGNNMRRTLERAKEVFKPTRPQKRGSKTRATVSKDTRPKKKQRSDVDPAALSSQSNVSTPIENKKVATKSKKKVAAKK